MLYSKSPVCSTTTFMDEDDSSCIIWCIPCLFLILIKRKNKYLPSYIRANVNEINHV